MGEPEKAFPPERFSAYIVIPAPIYFHPDLSSRAKMLYGLLSCMSNERGYAYPRNETLRRYMGGVSEDTVGRTLRELEKAEAIFVENGSGGSPKNIRKIYLGDLYPGSLRKNADPSLRKNADPNINSNNNKKKNKIRPSEAEMNQWISSWGAGLGYPMELVTPLIGDFFAFAESRKAKGKPFLTIRAVSMQANKLLKNTQDTADPTARVARMRYMLRSSITHNWEEVYPVGEAENDFKAWAAQEYGLQEPEKTDSPEYF